MVRELYRLTLGTGLSKGEANSKSTNEIANDRDRNLFVNINALMLVPSNDHFKSNEKIDPETEEEFIFSLNFRQYLHDFRSNVHYTSNDWTVLIFGFR